MSGFFALPIGLIALIAVPIIIALFALRPTRVRYVVASHMLWQEALRDVREGSGLTRLLRNLSLLLFVLAALSAALALGDPRWLGVTPGAKDLVIVLDISASMRADGASDSRINMAIAEARRRIDALPVGGRIAVLTSGRYPRVQLGLDNNLDTARGVLNEIAATDEIGDPPNALRLAVSLLPDRETGQVVFITDGAFDASLMDRFPAVELALVSTQESNNVAIANFDVRAEVGRDDRYQVLVTISNLSDSPVQTSLDVGAETRVLRTVAVELTANENKTVLLPMQGTMPRTLFARLDIEDGLAADNLAFTVPRLEEELRVALYTNGNFYLESVLSALPNIVVYKRNEEALSKFGQVQDAVNAITRQDFDLVIFDSLTPPRLPPGNYFFLNAIPPVAGIQERSTLTAVTLTEVSDNPLVSMVDPNALRIDVADSVFFDEGAGIHSLLKSGPHSIAVNQINEERRLIYLGFDPAESNFPLLIAFPLFIQESLRWLSPIDASRQVNHSEPGAPHWVRLPRGVDTVKIVMPGGARRMASTTTRTFRFDETATVGLYRYEMGQYRGQFAVMLNDLEESNLRTRARRRSEAPVDKLKPHTAVTETVLWPSLAALALFVLLIEWMVTAFRRRAAS